MNDTFSYMKAVAIICMVAGHSFTHSMIEDFVGLFHMPLFFFVSGYFFKDRYLQYPVDYLKKKLKKLWWPTFKWIIIVVLLHNTFFRIGIFSPDYPFGNTPPPTLYNS